MTLPLETKIAPALDFDEQSVNVDDVIDTGVSWVLIAPPPPTTSEQRVNVEESIVRDPFEDEIAPPPKYAEQSENTVEVIVTGFSAVAIAPPMLSFAVQFENFDEDTVRFPDEDRIAPPLYAEQLENTDEVTVTVPLEKIEPPILLDFPFFSVRLSTARK